MIAEMFGLGKLPPDAYQLLGKEQIQFQTEGVLASVILRNFSRGWGSYSNWKYQAFFGSLAVSDRRVIAYRGSTRVLNVPFADARFDSLEFEVANAKLISIQFSANVFQPKWSGTIQFRYPVEDAKSLVELIRLNRELARS